MPCLAGDQLGQPDRIELPINAGPGVGKEAIAGPTISVLS